MSSKRMLELVNVLYHDLADDLGCVYPFAGKQLILVGEFLQLDCSEHVRRGLLHV